MAVVVKLVNTTDCGSVIRPFESGQPPHRKEPIGNDGFFMFNFYVQLV